MQRGITGCGRAAITALADVRDREIVLSQQRLDRVTVVIDQDDVKVLEGLMSNAVQRILEQLRAVVGGQDNREQRLLLLPRLFFQALAKPARPGPQLGTLLVRIQIQTPLEVPRHLALTPVKVMLRIALEYAFDNGQVPHQWLAGGIKPARILRTMPAIADTRHVDVGEIGVTLRHLHDHFPVTSTVGVTRLPDTAKRFTPVDYRRGRHVKVVDQQISDFIAVAYVIAIAVSRMARPVQGLPGTIDPANAGIATATLGLFSSVGSKRVRCPGLK